VTGGHSSDRATRTGLLGRLRERGLLRVAASYAVIAWLAVTDSQERITSD
jgi:hypothetical protein